LAADECGLWLGARDPEAGQHYLKGRQRHSFEGCLRTAPGGHHFFGMATVLAPSRADRAFERLYRRYVADVYRYVLAVLQNESDAEDATQTAFLQAYRAYERGERAEKPLNWLIAIAHNVCRQRFRESARRPRLVELEEDNVADRVNDEEAPNAEEIRRALGFLAFNQRAALVMRELQGRSYGEIGRILGLSTSAVETLLFRARRAMREQLEGGLSCGEAELALSRRSDGQLSFAERGPLRAHLRECSECAALERGSRFRRRAIKSLGAVPLPSSLGSFFGGGAAVGTGVGVGAKAAAVVVAGVLGSGLAGDAIKERTARVQPPTDEAATRAALAELTPRETRAGTEPVVRQSRALASRRRPPAQHRKLTPAAPAAAAAGASLSIPPEEASAVAPESAPAPAQTPTRTPEPPPALPGVPARAVPEPPPVATPEVPGLPRTQLPQVPPLPEPKLPEVPPLPEPKLPEIPALPRPNLPELPKAPELKVPEVKPPAVAIPDLPPTPLSRP
jgi:RNA polymerase sigma factor (sigma-70 family)